MDNHNHLKTIIMVDTMFKNLDTNGVCKRNHKMIMYVIFQFKYA